MATLTVPNEFRNVQGHFPILFRREPGRDDFIALALFGFENGENLFLDTARWDARYRPWSLAIQPFLIGRPATGEGRSEEHTSELQSLMRISYAVFCLQKKKTRNHNAYNIII